MSELYRHARWVTFQLDGALMQPSDDRSFGLSLALRRGRLTGERLPNLELPEKDAPAWRGTFTLRGLHKLPAVWH